MKTGILELFCGTKSISKTFEEHGYESFTIDNDPRHNPDMCEDILKLESCCIPFSPSILWASPPCTCFSVASISTHWTGGKKAYIPKTNEAEISIKLVRKVLYLIGELQPDYWFIENPRGVLRKMPFMIELSKKCFRHEVSYCQYGDTRMKPTDIWTNNPKWISKPMCKNNEPCHEPAPRGSKTGTQGLKGVIERSIIPKALCLEILKCCEDI